MRFAFSVSIAFASCLVSAAPTGYVMRTTQQIDAVNLATNTEVAVGNAGFPTNSLAVRPNGQLYSADPNGMLFNVTGPVPIPVAPTGFTQIGDLDFAPGGFWGFSNTSQTLFFFSLASTTVTYTATLPALAPYTVTGVAYRPSDGMLFLSGNTGLNQDSLFSIMPTASPTVNLVGAMPNGDAASYFSDIDFDASGTLYAMSWFHRDFYSVNPLTGATTLVSNGPHRDVTALALPAAVPEPTTWMAIGMGMLAVSRKRRP